MILPFFEESLVENAIFILMIFPDCPISLDAVKLGDRIAKESTRTTGEGACASQLSISVLYGIYYDKISIESNRETVARSR